MFTGLLQGLLRPTKSYYTINIMKTQISIGLVLVFVLVVGGYYWHRERLLIHQEECANRLKDFQNPIIAETKQLNENRLQPTIGNAVEVKDFVVAFSPKLNTCIGGYTVQTYDWGVNKVGVYGYSYWIRDLNTNALIMSYSTIEEMVANKLSENGSSDETNINRAGDYASVKYHEKLRELSGGQLK